MRAISQTIIALSMILAAIAAVWVVCDLLFAAPAVLLLEEVAIICAVLAPLVCLFGWGMRWVACRLGA